MVVITFFFRDVQKVAQYFIYIGMGRFFKKKLFLRLSQKIELALVEVRPVLRMVLMLRKVPN